MATSQKLTTSTDSIAKSATVIQPTIQTLMSSTEPMSSIVESAKALAKAVEELKPPPPLSPPQPQQSHQNTQPTYAGVVETSTQCLLTSQTVNPEVPEYVRCIENRLCIQEHQVYIFFDNKAADSLKERNSSAAYMLRSKINEWIQSLDQETNQITSTLGQLIRVLQFTEYSTMLLEFDSKPHADRFQTYCKDKGLLTCICSTVKIQARTYCVVFKFIPCDSSFSSENKDYLRTMASEHNLKEGSIVAASWIKKTKH